MRTIIIYATASAVLLAGAPLRAATHAYRVTIDPGLREIAVQARFAPGVRSLSARARNARDLLTDARDCEHGASLDVGTRGIRLAADLHCLSYTVNLDGAADSDPRFRAAGNATVVVPITEWLWRPRLAGDDEIRVTFDLPAGVGISVPWQPIAGRDNEYRLRSSPQSGTGLAIIGRFDARVVHIAGDPLRIVAVPGEQLTGGADLVDWTRQAAEHITLAYGRFPSPGARVLLFPVSSRRDDSAVPFGRVVRDGGETVELLVDPRKPEASFVGDWTATHEFAHLMLPYLDRDQRWISEGFAQYYQNVLLARAGRYTPEEAWRKIAEGLQRGLESAPGLSPNQAAAGEERNTRMKIYWSGAALALMADVELRRRSSGTESLDTVLDRFSDCCLPSRHAWSGRELFATFDTLIDEPLFAGLYDSYANAAGFPDAKPLLTSAEFAEIRAAITARRYTDRPRD